MITGINAPRYLRDNVQKVRFLLTQRGQRGVALRASKGEQVSAHGELTRIKGKKEAEKRREKGNERGR